MRDCAFSPEIFDAALTQEVMRQSLLRDMEVSRVRERFHRLASGQLALTAYSFDYLLPPNPGALTRLRYCRSRSRRARCQQPIFMS